MISIIYPGRITIKQKRFDKLLELHNVLYKKKLNFSIDIFGDDRSLFFDREKYNNLIFHGYDKEWHKKIKKEHIFMLFSDYEGLPLSLLSFISSGGKNLLCRNFIGVENYLSKNCIFNSLDEAAYKLQYEKDKLTSTKSLKTFFNKSRFELEVSDLKKSIESI